MRKPLTEMSIKELEAYKKRWQKKRSRLKEGSKNFQKVNRRIKRANTQIALKEKKE